MGDNALSGLLPGGSESLFLFSKPQFDEQWVKSELIAARLIQGIQPSRHSEGKRKAIITYVERLIQRNFNCQVFTYGSVPLKTYLPDGDIDLSTFSWLPHSSEIWANDLRILLKREEHNKHAKFCVKEVQVIHAEVQIVKCLVDNVVVDISFNQLGGICTLCFLEEVDRLIGKDHLFKRSIILVKAWCYYESRILGAHHGLISTYALETLVLYIFNIFYASLRGPFEVLCKFLQFFSQFDWKHYCISLGGPIRLTMLHDMTAEPPQKDRSDLLFNPEFLFKCSQVYGVSPVAAQDFEGRNFITKNMNVVDPLKVDNNLGRSVNRGNFFRICHAFAYGAKQIEKLLYGSPDELLENMDEFFRNTRKFCNGHRPDVPVPRLVNVRNSGIESMVTEIEGVGVDNANHAIRISLEASQKANGRLIEVESTRNYDLREETVDTTDRLPGKGRVNQQDCESLSTVHNEYLADVPSRFEVSDTVDRRMNKLNASNANGVPIKAYDFSNTNGMPTMKANNSLPAVIDTNAYDRGNIENARDSSSSENGCNGACYGADSTDDTASIHRLDHVMPRCMADEQQQPAMPIYPSRNSSILMGDFQSYLVNLHSCRVMVAAQFCSPITFPPPVMFPVQHMFEPYASEGPGRPTNADMNLFSQVFSYNYEQYLNPSFQGLSLQNPYPMPSNRFYQGEVPKSHRGTGTYLPNLRSGMYWDTQQMRTSRHGASSAKFTEWSGTVTPDEARANASRYSHIGIRPEGSNARPEKRNSLERSLQENGHVLHNEKAKVPAAITANFRGASLPFPSHVHKYTPFVAQDLKTPNVQTNIYGTSCKNYNNGFLTESLEFGSLDPSSLGRPKKALIHDGPRKDHDGLQSSNLLDSKNGDREITAKKVLFNDNQRSLLKSAYELKDEDFPPLSTTSSQQASKSTGLTTQTDSTSEWPQGSDSSTRSLPKLQQNVDN